jgi:hypothetical protein
MAARRALTISPIKWHRRHVRGRQDRDKAHQLDQWERLNIEVDAEVRGFLHTAKRIPRHYIIGLEPWSLWYNKEKLSKIPSILYDLVHSREARPYWKNKNKVPEGIINVVYWEVIGQALRELPRSRRFFISKHTMGMCAVGRFMKIWGQRDSDACP